MHVADSRQGHEAGDGGASVLWRHGFRYRLHSGKLPGRPDIVIGRLKTVIFINGCFWHGHDAVPLEGGELADSTCCRIPHTNRQFWLDKINRNRQRDVANSSSLQAAGWRVITVWECQLKPSVREQTLAALLARLRPAPQYGYDEAPSLPVAAESETQYSKI